MTHTGNIILRAPQIRAAQDGRLSQVRMLAWKLCPVCKGQGDVEERFAVRPICEACRANPDWYLDGYVPSQWLKMHHRFQEAGEGYREWLWCQEEHCFGSYGSATAKMRAARGQNPVVYGTERQRMKQYKNFAWHPASQMPRWASRLTLEVTATKLERLQEIGQGDACAEGSPFGREPIDWFCNLWNSLHKDAPWESNPEVVALIFKGHQCNISEIEEAA